MSTNLFSYLQDGADPQARAVLAFLGDSNTSTLPHSARPMIARFENCREQGYVVSMMDEAAHEQINIIFAEHRNIDDIFIIKWLGRTLNSPTIADIPDDHPWKNNKFYNDGYFKYGKVSEAAEHIMGLLTTFWDEYRILRD